MKYFKWLFWKVKFEIDLRPDFWRHGVIIWVGTEFHNGDCYKKIINNYFEFDLTIVNCGFKMIIENPDFSSWGIK